MTTGRAFGAADDEIVTHAGEMPMTWLDYGYAWLIAGLVNYGIKLLKYHNDWRKDGNHVFFIAVLIAALVFGPMGLLVTLIRSGGNPFKSEVE